MNLNNLAIVKDFIFKETFIKETLNGLRDRKTKNLKDACEFLSIKKIPEKFRVSDLLIFIGFKINWNGLDYSESEIIFSHQQ